MATRAWTGSAGAFCCSVTSGVGAIPVESAPTWADETESVPSRSHPHRAAHARPADAAVPRRVLVEVLLVVRILFMQYFMR